MGKNKIRLLDIGAAGGIEGIQDLWLPHLGEIELSLCEPHEVVQKIKKQNFKIIDKAFGVEQKKIIFFTKHASRMLKYERIKFRLFKKIS